MTCAEGVAHAEQPGRSFRKLGLAAVFDWVDVNHDNTVSQAKIEAAHQSGLLARF